MLTNLSEWDFGFEVKKQKQTKKTPLQYYPYNFVSKTY